MKGRIRICTILYYNDCVRINVRSGYGMRNERKDPDMYNTVLYIDCVRIHVRSGYGMRNERKDPDPCQIMRIQHHTAWFSEQSMWYIRN